MAHDVFPEREGWHCTRKLLWFKCIPWIHVLGQSSSVQQCWEMGPNEGYWVRKTEATWMGRGYHRTVPLIQRAGCCARWLVPCYFTFPFALLPHYDVQRLLSWTWCVPGFTKLKYHELNKFLFFVNTPVETAGEKWLLSNDSTVCNSGEKESQRKNSEWYTEFSIGMH